MHRSLSMFYKRPDIPPLQLDLQELKGGGRCPAQYWGRTRDDRPVYIRYRNGRLSVQQGEPGADLEQRPVPPMETLLDVHFGPWLDGALLGEQACELAG